MTKNKILVASLAILMGSTVFAAPPRYKKEMNVMDTTNYSDYGNILSTETVYDEVIRPIEVCRKEMVKEEVYPEPRVVQQEGDSVAGVIIGGLAGGILGNQVGKGTGKDLATAAGAVTGAIVGNNLAKKNNQQQIVGAPRLVEREVLMCNTENKTEKVVKGYNVEYSYNGRVFNSFVRDKPHDNKIRLSVSVNPQ
jgi:uncharacterized protein YcfJ